MAFGLAAFLRAGPASRSDIVYTNANQTLTNKTFDDGLTVNNSSGDNAMIVYPNGGLNVYHLTTLHIKPPPTLTYSSNVTQAVLTNGTDTSGRISLESANATGVFFITLTFQTPWTAISAVLLTPMTDAVFYPNTIALNTYVAGINTAGDAFAISGTITSTSQRGAWSYLVIGYDA